MAVDGPDLVGELKALRKGRGVLIRQIGERVGPALRELCGVADSDGSVEIRGKVTERLKGLASLLPEDLCLVVMAAFAMHHEARGAFYQERVRWVAERLGREERTVRRRIDEAIDRLAELATTLAAGLDVDAKAPDWHTEELRVAVVLDQGAPESFEFRRVVANRDGVDELDLAFTLTVSPGLHVNTAPYGPHINVVYGGTLLGRRKESTDRVAFVLALPKPLQQAERHDYAARFRVPEGHSMAPHFVSVLRTQCAFFDLRVRFDLAHPPRRIWRIADAFQRDIDDPALRGPEVSMDAAGEIHLVFRDLMPGLAYGARWE